MINRPMAIFFFVALCYFFATVVTGCTAQATEPLKLAWHGKVRNHQEWTNYIVKLLKVTDLPDEVPADIKDFCPRYSKLDDEKRVEFWAQLVSIMTKRESGFKPESYMYECNKEKNVYGKGARYDKVRGWCMTGGHKLDGGFVISRGLLQMSLSSAQRYGCDVEKPSDLHDAKKNLACALRILNNWVGKDNRLAGKSSSGWKGGARYWAVLRTKSRSYPVVRDYVKKLPFCS